MTNVFPCPNLKYLNLPGQKSWTSNNIEKIAQDFLLSYSRDLDKIIQMYLEVILYENPQTSYQGLYFGNLLEKSANQFSETYSQSRQGEYKYLGRSRADYP